MYSTRKATDGGVDSTGYFLWKTGFSYTGLSFSLGIVMLKSRKASFPSNLSQTKRICFILLPPEDSVR